MTDTPRKQKKEKAGTTPTQEELQQQMIAIQKQKIEAFEKAYQELCKEHGFQLVPEIILRAGELPRAIQTSAPLALPQ